MCVNGHTKIYSGEFSTCTAPPKWSWVCKVCGAQGSDQLERPEEVDLRRFAETVLEFEPDNLYWNYLMEHLV